MYVHMYKLASFPGLRPDFISQPWRKIGRRPAWCDLSRDVCPWRRRAI